MDWKTDGKGGREGEREREGRGKHRRVEGVAMVNHKTSKFAKRNTDLFEPQKKI